MNDLTPALSAEEWAKGKYRIPGVANLALRDGRLLVSGDAWDTDSVHTQAVELHALVALSNAALSDSDPRKITRADVQMLEELAEDVDGEWGVGDMQDPKVLLILALAAKLAALLPP